MSTRADLFDLLKAYAWSKDVTVYAYPPDLLKLPAVIVDESDPAIEPDTQGRLFRFNFEVRLAIKYNRPRDSVVMMDAMRKDIEDALYGSSFALRGFGKTSGETVGDIVQLESVAFIQIRLEQL